VLYDHAKIYVEGGSGGNGAIAFRREAHVPRGGPEGGDGGRGGDVAVVCDGSLRDLKSLRQRVHYRANKGQAGSKGARHGASGQTLEIRVPPGTVVGDPRTGTSYDFTVPGQRSVVASGGAGGRGNLHFATSTRQTPRFAELGLSGDSGWLDLELKLLADAGLVGLPNAGKSSLLARMTRAHPKVADYPFTTLQPVLGTLERGDRQLIIADIPGLIEGASKGVGLGHEFLSHVERTRLLVHVIDLAPVDQSDPFENYKIVQAEVASYGHGLEALSEIVCLSKADLVGPQHTSQQIRKWRSWLDERVVEVIATSVATGEGMEELSYAIDRHMPPEGERERSLQPKAPIEHKVYRPAAETEFAIEQVGPSRFKVTGTGVERLIARHDHANEDAMRYVEERLEAMGVIQALVDASFTPGDEVEIAGVEFDLYPNPSRHR
jgi:GTPase